MSRHLPPRAHGRRRVGTTALGCLVALLVVGCASAAGERASFEAQPSLTPEVVEPVVPDDLGGGPSSAAPTTPPSTAPSTPRTPSSGPSSSAPATPPPSGSAEADPCRPADPAVIAACLDAPWGLALLPGGTSALVGERTTGRILQIAPQQQPVEYARIGGLDTSGGGGLLGIALSPAFDEDGLIYLYVTTRTDNRVLRLAKGDRPKPILTGIPRGSSHNGGTLLFGADGQLYIGTGDTGRPELARDPASLAGKVLRIDEFGKPSKGNPRSGSPVFARGFTDVTGMCTVNGKVGALDHRTAADVLVAPRSGTDYSATRPPHTVWSWRAGEGGANDCAQASRQLGATSLPGEKVTAITTDATGAFVGTPETLVQKTYGRLLTLEVGGTGDQQLFWATTSNKDGRGKPVASDDRVVVIRASGGGGDGGND